MVSQSLSVSFPQRSRAAPVNCFHVPSIWSQFMLVSWPPVSCVSWLWHVYRRLHPIGLRLELRRNLHSQTQILHGVARPDCIRSTRLPIALGPARAHDESRHFQFRRSTE